MSGAFKAIKKVGSKVAGAFKKVAKKVKKIGQKILKPIGELYAKTFGKLGPLGVIAASFILPGLGTMLAGWWSSAASALLNTTIGCTFGTVLQAVGQGMTYVGSLPGTIDKFIGKIGTSISDKVTSTLTGMGNSITEGANNLFTSAQTALGSKNPLTIQDLGKKVVDGANKLFKQGPQNQLNPGMDDIDFLAKGLEGPVRPPLTVAGNVVPGSIAPGGIAPGGITSGVGNVVPGGTAVAPNLNVAPGGFAPGAAPTAGIAPGIPGAPTVGAAGTPLTNIAPGGTAGVVAKPSLLTSVGAALVDTFAQARENREETATPFISELPVVEENLLSARGAFSGVGAGGGSFLSPAQQAFFEAERRRLGGQF